MAHETTEPRTTLIVFFTALSAVTLMLMQPIFNSYFDSIMGDQARVQQVENSRYYRAYQALEAEQKAALSNGSVPIERAMDAVATRRHELSAIQPEPSMDVQALAGWSFHPDYEAPPPAPPPPTEAAPSDEPAEGEVGEEGGASEDRP